MSTTEVLFGGAWKFYTYISPAIITTLTLIAYYYHSKVEVLEQEKDKQ